MASPSSLPSSSRSHPTPASPSPSTYCAPSTAKTRPEPAHPTARGALCACARLGGLQALRAPEQSCTRSALTVPPCGLSEAPPRTPVWGPRLPSCNPVWPRWSMVWSLASSSASSLADAQNSSTAATAGKISLLLVLLGLGTQFSRFAHTQLQAPAHARAPQMHARRVHAQCTLGGRQMHGRCTADARSIHGRCTVDTALQMHGACMPQVPPEELVQGALSGALVPAATPPPATSPAPPGVGAAALNLILSPSLMSSSQPRRRPPSPRRRAAPPRRRATSPRADASPRAAASPARADAPTRSPPRRAARPSPRRR